MLVAILLAIAGGGMFIIERTRPRREFDYVARWHVRGVGLSLVQIAVAFGGTWWLDPLLAQIRFVDAAPLGPFWGALYGYLAVTFLWYWWHRARHEVPFLWRTLHQVHHSPSRLEMLTTYFKHPLESATNVVLGGVTLTIVLGLTPTQSALVATACGLAEFFYHWNVETPHWVGWFIQRPEAHCIHHARGRHTHNYADLPLWDWLFGTLDNPVVDEVPCGFEPDDELRLLEMLAAKVVA